MYEVGSGDQWRNGCLLGTQTCIHNNKREVTVEGQRAGGFCVNREIETPTFIACTGAGHCLRHLHIFTSILRTAYERNTVMVPI